VIQLTIITKKMLKVFRHLADVHDLRNYGFDGPLLPGQSASKIAQVLQARNIIWHGPKLRVVQTADLVKSELAARGVEAELKSQKGLDDLDQGVVKLPAGYEAGQELVFLKKCWAEWCRQVYYEKNWKYKFGMDAPNNFHRFGDSLIEFLEFYKLFQIILEQPELEEKIVLCTHSTVMHTIAEFCAIAEFAEDEDVVFQSLPSLCYQLYSDRKFPPIGFGQLMEYDLTKVRLNVMPKIEQLIVFMSSYK